jgi:phosphatidate cytidylyltransferase
VLKRLFSTLVLWSIVVAVILLFKRDGVVVALGFFVAATQYELYAMLEKLGHRPFRGLGVTLGLLLIGLPYLARRLLALHETGAPPLLGPEEVESMESALIAITIVACGLRVMRERQGANRMETLVATVFGLVYVPFMLSFLVRTLWLGTPDPATGAPREIEGLMLTIWILFSAKFCDVGALVAGTLFGRHKMAPSMSPLKTWEGAVGGVIVAAGMCAALVAAFRSSFPAAFHPWVAALLAIPPAIVSITADLIESVMKRVSGVKDSGGFVPGIGGAFDLTDSVILAAPVGYLLIRMVLLA